MLCDALVLLRRGANYSHTAKVRRGANSVLNSHENYAIDGSHPSSGSHPSYVVLQCYIECFAMLYTECHTNLIGNLAKTAWNREAKPDELPLDLSIGCIVSDEN